MTFYTVLYNITITSSPFLTVYIVEGVDEIKEQWNSSYYLYYISIIRHHISHPSLQIMERSYIFSNVISEPILFILVS